MKYHPKNQRLAPPMDGVNEPVSQGCFWVLKNTTVEGSGFLVRAEWFTNYSKYQYAYLVFLFMLSSWELTYHIPKKR